VQILSKNTINYWLESTDQQIVKKFLLWKLVGFSQVSQKNIDWDLFSNFQCK